MLVLLWAGRTENFVSFVTPKCVVTFETHTKKEFSSSETKKDFLLLQERTFFHRVSIDFCHLSGNHSSREMFKKIGHCWICRGVILDKERRDLAPSDKTCRKKHAGRVCEQ